MWTIEVQYLHLGYVAYQYVGVGVEQGQSRSFDREEPDPIRQLTWSIPLLLSDKRCSPPFQSCMLANNMHISSLSELRGCKGRFMSKSKFNVARECQNHLWEVGQNPRIKETNRRDFFFKLILMSGNRYMYYLRIQPCLIDSKLENGKFAPDIISRKAITYQSFLFKEKYMK